MATEPRILIAGGYGVFGRLLAGELLRNTSAQIVIAGRNRRRAVEACRALAAPERLEALELDLTKRGMLSKASRGCLAVICAAGPFTGLPASLPEEALAAGAHWLDIADDRQWLLRLLLPIDRHLDALAREKHLAVIPGLSTTPALSGLLARTRLEGVPSPVRISLTLFIGNRNAKGAAAIASLIESCTGAARMVRTPFGNRLACGVPTADSALLRREVGLAADFAVAFEFPPAGPVICAVASVLRRCNRTTRGHIARVASRLLTPLSLFGRDTGVLQAELTSADGSRRNAALIGSGQRMAILPCAIVLESLLDGTLSARGVISPATYLPADDWMQRLRKRGLLLVTSG
jgi:short subunit dehydrogenase-like uncharacterized protein